MSTNSNGEAHDVRAETPDCVIIRRSSYSLWLDRDGGQRKRQPAFASTYCPSNQSTVRWGLGRRAEVRGQSKKGNKNTERYFLHFVPVFLHFYPVMKRDKSVFFFCYLKTTHPLSQKIIRKLLAHTVIEIPSLPLHNVYDCFAAKTKKKNI